MKIFFNNAVPETYQITFKTFHNIHHLYIQNHSSFFLLKINVPRNEFLDEEASLSKCRLRIAGFVDFHARLPQPMPEVSGSLHQGRGGALVGGVRNDGALCVGEHHVLTIVVQSVG